MTYLKTLALASCLAVLPATGAGAVTFTGSTGSGQSFTNMQPSLGLTQYIQNGDAYFPTRDESGINGPGYLGQIRTFGYGATNFFQNPAQGATLSIGPNVALYSLLGTQYGGNGQSTFNLPNLSGATMVGAGNSANGSTAGNYAVGTALGQNATTMSVAQMPVHDHGLPGIEDTGNAGGGQSIDNRQASLAITYSIVANGGFQFGGDGIGFIGEIQAFAGNFAPNGNLAAIGQLLPIAEYAGLYAIMGTTYGGDGIQTFRLPDLTGRTAVGASTFTDATHLRIGMGEATGTNAITLTEANLPAHVHSLPDGTTTEADGGNQAFSTTQPSLGVNYIINTGGDGKYPQRNGSPYAFEYMLGEVTAYAGSAELLPTGWSIADGSLLSIAQNQALYSLLGITYGGNGTTTFALPDLRGRTVIGTGTRDGAIIAPGQVRGSTTVQLGIGNLPSHVHSLPEVSAVPEPASWAMMIVGMGAVGGTLRRRRGKVTTQVAFAA